MNHVNYPQVHAFPRNYSFLLLDSVLHSQTCVLHHSYQLNTYKVHQHLTIWPLSVGVGAGSLDNWFSTGAQHKGLRIWHAIFVICWCVMFSFTYALFSPSEQNPGESTAVSKPLVQDPVQSQSEWIRVQWENDSTHHDIILYYEHLFRDLFRLINWSVKCKRVEMWCVLDIWIDGQKWEYKCVMFSRDFCDFFEHQAKYIYIYN